MQKIYDLLKAARIADAITNKFPYLREDEIGYALQTVVFSNANIPSNWHSALNNTLNIFLKRLKRNIFLGVLSSDQLINDYFKMVSMNLNYIPHNISTKIINGKDGIIDLMIKDLTILQKLNNKINNYDNKTEINYFECSILCFLKLNYDKFNNFGTFDTFDLEKINILKFISKGLIEFIDKTYENTNKLVQMCKCWKKCIYFNKWAIYFTC